MTLTFAQIFQLYAPLAGLVLMSFWLGVLSQRVRALETTVKRMEDGDAEGGMVDRLARLEVHSENAGKALEKISREMEGMQRQMGNLFTRDRT